MRKTLKIILAILEVACIGVLGACYVLPSFKVMISKYYSYVFAATVLLTLIWVIIICIDIYRKEVGYATEGKIKYHVDVERHKEVDINDADSKDVYSNFERAEFAPKIRDTYIKDIKSFPETFTRKHKVEPVKEEINPYLQPVNVQEPKKVEPVKEEIKQVEPIKVNEPVKVEPIIDEIKKDEEVKVVEEVKPIEEIKKPVVEEVKKPTVEDKLQRIEEAKKAEKKPEIIIDNPVEEKKIEVKKATVQQSKVSQHKQTSESKEKVEHKLVDFTIFEGNTVKVSDSWIEYLNAEKDKKYFATAMNAIKDCYNDQSKTTYPLKENILKPFELTDLDNVKVVVIGKIPHYRKNQADGLAFSTDKNVAPNPATKVIIKEAMEDVGISEPANGSFEKWAKEGVFLINTCLTAPNDKPASHVEYWEKFTYSFIDLLAKSSQPKVFVLWGEHAQSFKELIIKNKANYILEAPNPSPLSAANGFYGSKPFSKINEFLTSNGYDPIDWNL